MNYIDIVFDGPPAPESGRFVEVENETGTSISFGEWVDHNGGDGWCALRIQASTALIATAPEMLEMLEGMLRRAIHRPMSHMGRAERNGMKAIIAKAKGH